MSVKMAVENNRRKSFDARLAGRQKYRTRIIVISENQRLDSHVEDRIDGEQRVFRGRFAFVNKYRAETVIRKITRKKLGDRSARIVRC